MEKAYLYQINPEGEIKVSEGTIDVERPGYAEFKFEKINELFEIMMLFYKDVLNIKINRPIEYFMDYNEELKNVESKNMKELLTKKINVIETLKEKIKFNVNIGLLIDKLIIEMDRCYND